MRTKRILKFPMAQGQTNISIKCNFDHVLDIQLQDSTMMAWVLTDSEKPEIIIDLIPIGTGWTLPAEVLESMKYIKTVQDNMGYVWHYHLKIS